MKKVSVIIPVYNGEKYIEQTIKNILQSTYSNLELIIVNDGSMDSSLSICEKLKESDSRILIYTKKNEGVAVARNYGLTKVTGDYICFCDQDDIVEPKTYENQVKSIEETQSDFCMCSTGRNIDGKKSDFEISQNQCYAENQILEELLYPLLFSGFQVPIKMSHTKRYPHIWSCMFKSDFIRKYNVKFRSYINFEDDLLFKVDVLSKASKVATISYIGYYWRVNLKSETYHHEYIENIKEKQQKCYEDMFSCISDRISDTNIQHLFTQVTFCKQYLEAVHNLTSPCFKKTYKFINGYYRDVIYERNFTDCISAKKYIKKGQVKLGILLPLISKKRTYISYYTEIVLERILLITLHSQTLTKMERFLKRS